jgi:hypothetical protein
MPKAATAAKKWPTLSLFTRLPKGHQTVCVNDATSEPLLQKGQYAVIDGADRRPRHGEIFAIKSLSGRSPYLMLVESSICNIGRGPQRVWWMKAACGWRQVDTTVGPNSQRVPVFVGLSDGPYRAGHLTKKLLLGRVIGYAMSSLGKPLVGEGAA